jgi:hypothetical protein
MADESVGRHEKTATGKVRSPRDLHGWDVETARRICDCRKCNFCGFTAFEPPPVAGLRLMYGANTPDEEE